jgi:DnaK suppressor protein
MGNMTKGMNGGTGRLKGGDGEGLRGLDEVTRGRLPHSVLVRLAARLQSERREAATRLERRLYDARAANDVTVGDEVDKAVESEEVTRLLEGARKERALIREIDRALAKVSSGGYGICEGTGEPIDGRRLEAQPWTRYSLDFLEEIERRQPRH